MQNKIRIGYTKDVIIDHHPIRDDKYLSYRERGDQFFQQFLRSNNIAGAINFAKKTTINTQWNPHQKGILSRHGMSQNYSINPYCPFDARGEDCNEFQDEHYKMAYDFMIQHKLKSILDVGCGNGFKLIKYFKKMKLAGVEIEPALSFLRQKYHNDEWFDGEDPNTFSGRHDLILCMDVIEHLVDPSEFLIKLDYIDFKYAIFSTPDRTALEKDGLRTSNGPPSQPYHIREWSLEEFYDYLSIFFKIHEQIKLGYYQMVICEKIGYDGPFEAISWEVE